MSRRPRIGAGLLFAAAAIGLLVHVIVVFFNSQVQVSLEEALLAFAGVNSRAVVLPIVGGVALPTARQAGASVEEALTDRRDNLPENY
ncbi:MAG: hypothetical protein ACE5LS_02925 [Thermoplasmata archaeon]